MGARDTITKQLPTRLVGAWSGRTSLSCTPGAQCDIALDVARAQYLEDIQSATTRFQIISEHQA